MNIWVQLFFFLLTKIGIVKKKIKKNSCNSETFSRKVNGQTRDDHEHKCMEESSHTPDNSFKVMETFSLIFPQITITNEFLFLRNSESQTKRISLIKLTMMKANSLARIWKAIRWFRCGRRPHYCNAFIYFPLEAAMRAMVIDASSTISTKSSQWLGFADDLDIMGRNMSVVKKKFEA